MIHLYTGEGKGKTTAAIGCAVRAEGARQNVLFVQFMKDGTSGEVNALKRLEHLTVLANPFPHGFARDMDGAMRARVTAAHDHNLQNAVACARGGHVDLIVLDEICAAYAEDLVDRAAVDAFLRDHGQVELVLTGRDPAPLMLELADYITDMRCVRHPYQKGVPARRGVEY